MSNAIAQGQHLALTRLLLVDMPYPQGREWQHETRHRLGYMAVPGGMVLPRILTDLTTLIAGGLRGVIGK